MSRNLKFSLIIAAVTISSCQAADKETGTSTLAELFKRDNIQHVTRELKHEEVFTVKLVDGSVASARHESDGSKDTYSAAIAQKKVGMGGFTPRDFEFVGVTQGEHYELTHPANPQQQFDLIKQAFQQQEQDLTTLGLSSSKVRDSIVHPFDIADPEIVCWTKKKYIVAALGDCHDEHRISHAVRQTCKDKQEIFKTFRFSPNPYSFPITQEEFIEGAKTPGAEHYSKEIYEARLADGGSVRTGRTHKNQQDKFDAYRLTTAYPFRRDAHHDAHRQATFQVVKSAYIKQLARRESQAAKPEETKKD